MPSKPPSTSFTVQSRGPIRVLKTEVGVGQSFDPRHIHKLQSGLPSQKKYTAVWDTGATGTVISKRVIAECSLKPISRVIVNTVGGHHESGVYMVTIVLPNNVYCPLIRATEGVLMDGFDVLIGMDIITLGDFAITNKNLNTTFSFRVPPSACIDFVKQELQKNPKTEGRKYSRNAPCPCGSNKKYKKCCGK